MVPVPIIKQVPPDEVNGKILFAGSDGKIYNKHGHQLKHAFSPAKRKRRNGKSGTVYPCLTQFNVYCHRIIGRTFLRKLRKGEVYDHINGDILNYSLRNLRVVKIETNYRDAGFLRKLRNKRIDPTWFDQKYLLLFFARMARKKKELSKWYYLRLTRTDLLKMLVTPDYTVDTSDPMSHDMTNHCEC